MSVEPSIENQRAAGVVLHRMVRLNLRIKHRTNMNNTWKIEYDNDTGPSDEGFWEWWIVTNVTKSFKCDSQEDAQWLCGYLNAHSA